MDLRTGAMGSLIPKLDELLKEEYKLQTRVRRDVHYLSKELRSLHAALRKVADVPRDQLDEQVRLWADKVRELSYSMEDVVDTLLVGVDLDGPLRFLTKMLKMLNMTKRAKTRLELADSIREMKQHVQEVAAPRDRCKVGDAGANPAAQTTVDSRLLALDKNQRELVGIEDAMGEVIKRLADGDVGMYERQLKILSICGFGGLGKTTLAKAVYDSMRAQFDLGAFVSVSRNPDVKTVLKKFFIEINKQKYMDFSAAISDLINELRVLLENKRYLIVIDDIWDITTWEVISFALPDTNCGSRVITTTRILEVAIKAGEVYKLNPLSRENSKELLYTRLFGGTENRPYDQLSKVLSKLLKEILQKCGGVPLAIITIASLLAQTPKSDWSTVYNSFGFGNRGIEHVESMRDIVLYSYHDLPSCLKTSLLHLSIFPEGYMIRKDTLIWKWVAEGFVQEEPIKMMGSFEIGERYFNELINRSLLQPVEIPHTGITIGCRVHALVLDMICFLSKEENFVTVLGSDEQHISSQINFRHLAFQNRVVDEHDSLDTPQLRSFNATVCHVRMMPSLSNLQFLRVLAMEGCTFIGGHFYHLKYLGKLLQLKYLGLLNMPIRDLPEEIGDLRFLQTLDLRQTRIEELPQSVVRLRGLKCLRVGNRSTRVPAGMGSLTYLEELQLGDVGSSPDFMKEVGMLTELRELKIWIRVLDERSKKALVESLGNLQKIQVLHLDGGSWIEEADWEGFVPPRQLRHLILQMKSYRMPGWINPSLLPHLSHLSVDVRVVEARDLEILGSFPGLLTLKLFVPNVSLDFRGRGAFPSLRHCYASGMLRFLEGAAPRLESVNFNVLLWDSKAANFEFGSLGNLPLLQEVRVEIFYSVAHGAREVEEVEAALRHAVDMHPSRPILEVSIYNSSCDEPDDENEDDDDVDEEEVEECSPVAKAS